MTFHLELLTERYDFISHRSSIYYCANTSEAVEVDAFVAGEADAFVAGEADAFVAGEADAFVADETRDRNRRGDSELGFI